MPNPYTMILGQTFQTYTLLIGSGIILSIVTVSFVLRDRVRFARVIDVALMAIVGGLVFARFGHVLLQWNYFSENQQQIFQIASGGLDWHGAVLGALLGGFIGAYVFRVPPVSILSVMARMLPVLAFLGWWACGASACAYGEEVDVLYRYPTYLVWEYRDVYGLVQPRYRTQSLGMMVSAFLFVIALVLTYFNLLYIKRFWLILGLLSLIMFSIGFLRGDANPMWQGLRVDQWLDAIYFIVSMVIVFAVRESPAHATASR